LFISEERGFSHPAFWRGSNGHASPPDRRNLFALACLAVPSSAFRLGLDGFFLDLYQVPPTPT